MFKDYLSVNGTRLCHSDPKITTHKIPKKFFKRYPQIQGKLKKHTQKSGENEIAIP